MATIVPAPVFNAVAEGIGVHEFEYNAIIGHYCRYPRNGRPIPGAGGAKQELYFGYCVISYYSRSYDTVLLVDIYRRDCSHDWDDSEKETFKNIILMYRAARYRASR